jgi:hypothetical protein
VSPLEAYPAIALVLIVGAFWWYGWRQRRRLRQAVTDAATQLDGRYEPGTHTSGGSLTGTYAGRDVVFTFFLSTTLRGESTTVSVSLKKPVRERFQLNTTETLARAPRLAAFRRWYYPLKLEAKSQWVSIDVPGVIRDSGQLLDLAAITTHAAEEIDSGGAHK